MVQRVVGLSAKLQTVPLANREQLVQRQIYIHLARAERGIVAYVAERRELRPAEGPAACAVNGERSHRIEVENGVVYRIKERELRPALMLVSLSGPHGPVSRSLPHSL